MKFNIIYADPAWEYRDKANAGERGAEFKYPCMTLGDIQALPVKDLAANNSALFLWVTGPLLKDGIETLEKWGFQYKTIAFTWVKVSKDADPRIFGGSYTRSNSELCLLGIKGRMTRKDKGVKQVIITEHLGHSVKPDAARVRIVKLFGNLARVELFAREQSSGWISLGDEIDGRDLRDSIPDLISQ